MYNFSDISGFRCVQSLEKYLIMPPDFVSVNTPDSVLSVAPYFKKSRGWMFILIYLQIISLILCKVFLKVLKVPVIKYISIYS